MKKRSYQKFKYIVCSDLYIHELPTKSKMLEFVRYQIGKGVIMTIRRVPQ